MADLEKQGISTSEPSERYGTIEADPKKAPSTSNEKMPLFLGLWEVSPDQIFRYGLICYVGWFVLHRVADVAYIMTVDARFPEGLGHLYPSEQQRLESVSYTRQVMLCAMLHRIVVFIAVMILVCFGLFARFDACLRTFFAGIATWWATSKTRDFFVRTVWNCLACICSPFGRCLWYCFRRPGEWLLRLKDRAYHGRLAADLSNRFGFRMTIAELLMGGLYLSCFGALFFLMSAPFAYWMQSIDLKFGFANSLSVSLNGWREKVVVGFISTLISGILPKFAFLAVLQYRFGWALMWAGLIITTIYAQYNIKMIAPMLGMDMKFPKQNFAVGRGFPMTETANKGAPWITLNRLYFPDKFSQSLDSQAVSNVFYTDDKSKGQLALTNHAGKWTISGTAWFDPTAPVYASTEGSAAGPSLDSLREQSWSVGNAQTKMGVRSGKELRDKLFGFARDRQIGIGNIFMVDGSHKDARANAFVTGAGNHSIIGLYDTLFLGQRGSDAQEQDDEDLSEQVTEKSLIQRVGEKVQGVDLEEEEQDRRPPRNSADTEAMNDDEIVAILAHELAHSALKHMEQGMVAQVVTQFITFASLGWMTQSPLAAAALSLSAPILHVGAAAYDHVVGPPLEGMMKLFTDGLTRHNEYEADAYAAQISQRYGIGLQTALAKLSVNSNQDPDPPFFYEALHSDHPPFARRWEHIEKVMKKTYGENSKP